MSYTTRKYQGLGGILDAASAVTSDPCLNQVSDLANQLSALQQTPGASTPTPGVGLCKLVQPLQVVVWAETNPMLAMAAAAGAVGLLIAIGYGLAKR